MLQRGLENPSEDNIPSKSDEFTLRAPAFLWERESGRSILWQKTFEFCLSGLQTVKGVSMRLLQKSRFLVDGLNAIMNDIRELPEAVRGKDPAARSTAEVLLLYPGVKAVLLHRVSHALWQMEAQLPARFLSELGRTVTGVEIHPGASLGRRVVIDHGMGTVIGETAVVGDDCLIFQNVTLGSSRNREGQRHPTLERGVVVGVGATVIGPVHVGEEAKIGAGAVVVGNVEANTTVTGIPAATKKRREPESRASSPIPLHGTHGQRRERAGKE
ncbi:MAG: hypothetical protein RL189_2154 [Pseudomonadota bacterium]|jgi:serine O-acetyltransferase